MSRGAAADATWIFREGATRWRRRPAFDRPRRGGLRGAAALTPRTQLHRGPGARNAGARSATNRSPTRTRRRAPRSNDMSKRISPSPSSYWGACTRDRAENSSPRNIHSAPRGGAATRARRKAISARPRVRAHEEPAHVDGDRGPAPRARAADERRHGLVRLDLRVLAVDGRQQHRAEQRCQAEDEQKTQREAPSHARGRVPKAQHARADDFSNHRGRGALPRHASAGRRLWLFGVLDVLVHELLALLLVRRRRGRRADHHFVGHLRQDAERLQDARRLDG